MNNDGCELLDTSFRNMDCDVAGPSTYPTRLDFQFENLNEKAAIFYNLWKSSEGPAYEECRTEIKLLISMKYI